MFRSLDFAGATIQRSQTLISSINPSPPKVWHKVIVGFPNPSAPDIQMHVSWGTWQQKSMNVLDSWCGSILSHGWEILKQNWLHSVFNVHGHLTVTPHDLLTFSCFQSHSKPHCVHLCLHLCLCALVSVCKQMIFVHLCLCCVHLLCAPSTWGLRLLEGQFP